MAIRVCPLVFHYLYENVCYRTSGVQTANEWCMPAVISSLAYHSCCVIAALTALQHTTRADDEMMNIPFSKETQQYTNIRRRGRQIIAHSTAYNALEAI